MYTMLTTLWKFFYHSPKRCENLKEVQKVQDLLKLEITKHSDTRWLAHGGCVSAVKDAMVTVKQVYEKSH